MPTIDPAVSQLMHAQQAALADRVATTVAAKSLDSAKQQGEAMIGLVEAAAELGKSLHTGKLFDAIA